MPPVHLRALVLVTAAAIVAAGPAPPLAPHGHSGLLNLGDCYAMTETLPITGGPVNCAATTAREADGCFLLCGICAVPALRFGLAAAERKSLCSPPAAGDAPAGGLSPKMVDTISNAVLAVSATHGYHMAIEREDFINKTIVAQTDSMGHLLAHMSRADTQILLTQPFQFIDYLVEHINYAYKVKWGTKWGANITYELWRENVLPFGLMDEKRDLWWRWRPTFFRTFHSANELSAAKTITDAVKALAALIPNAEMQGVTALSRDGGNRELISGDPVQWHSGSSPTDMSSQQIVENGGSCTGTAILLAAVLRSVGVPARVAGCSDESVAAAQGNDHHWVEFWDPTDPGPFGDFWHTKEGVSKGNAGGPWDGASGPMNGCMRGLTAKSSKNMIYATSWSSPRFMPTLWGMDEFSQTNRFKGGIPRCKQYCGLWGCGVNQSLHFNTTAEGTCEPPLIT